MILFNTSKSPRVCTVMCKLLLTVHFTGKEKNKVKDQS